MSYAAYFDKPEIITFLHSIGCDVKQRSKTGESPLLRACYYKRYSSIEELLRLGAEINEKQNEYPLIQALYRQNLDLTLFLLDRGADPSVVFTESHQEMYENLPQKVKDALIGYNSFKERVLVLFTYKYGKSFLNKLPSSLAKEAIMFLG
jgi:ankyrin repeat protein